MGLKPTNQKQNCIHGRLLSSCRICSDNEQPHVNFDNSIIDTVSEMELDPNKPKGWLEKVIQSTAQVAAPMWEGWKRGAMVGGVFAGGAAAGAR